MALRPADGRWTVLSDVNKLARSRSVSSPSTPECGLVLGGATIIGYW